MCRATHLRDRAYVGPKGDACLLRRGIAIVKGFEWSRDAGGAPQVRPHDQ